MKSFTITSGQVVLLRIEGASLFTGCLVAYSFASIPWWVFATLFLVPDLSMLGYLKGNKVGAACYNSLHTTALPIVVIAVSCLLHQPLGTAIGLTWLAHIGFDRMLGYGLKSPEGFKITHLGALSGGAQVHADGS